MPYHRTLTALAALIVALAGLATACGNGSDDEPQAARPTTAAAAATAPATSTPAEPAAPFEGTWRAGPAPLSKIVAALETAGMREAAETVLLGNNASSRLTSELKVQGGYVLVSWSVDDQALGVQDRQAYTASGSSLVLTPVGASCSESLNWTVTGDQLSFELVDDTCPDYKDAPDEAMMVGLYTSLPFQRVEA